MRDTSTPSNFGHEVSGLRVILFYTSWVLWSIALSPSIVVFTLMNSSSVRVRALSRLWVRGVLYLLKLCCALTYKVEGVQNIQGKALYLCNHQSIWETMVIGLLIPDIIGVAKVELLRLPVFGWFMKRSPMIMIDRSNPREALRLMKKGVRGMLEANHSVVIWPEGTRANAEDIIVFKGGLSRVLSGLECAVVPICVNSGLFWNPRRFKLRSGCITISFLKPLECNGNNAEEIVTNVERLLNMEKERLVGKQIT